MTQDPRPNVRANPNGDLPEIDPTAYIDPSAQLIGAVRIGPRVFVGPNAVIRADELSPDGDVKPIIIEAECNIQDGVIIHALAGTHVTVGPRTSLSHGAIVHGPCSLGGGCFVGFGAVVFKARIGSGVFISARAVIEGPDVPADAFVPSSAFSSQDQIDQLRRTDPHRREFMEKVVQMNLKLAENYLNHTQDFAT